MAALPTDAVVAVIGAGAMGAGIAQVASQAGHNVLLFDARTGVSDRARASVGATLDGLAAKGRMTAESARAIAGRIVPVHALADCAAARLVIEAIVEDLDAKRDLLRELDVIVDADAILASNTSSLSITSLAAGSKHPSRVVGMHFFNPAPVLPLVEVVSGLATADGVSATVHATALAWGKFPVHAASTPGFIVNRCARPFYGEALRLLTERAADVPTIDAVMRDAGGFRMGPFELMDLVGHDVNFAVTKSVWSAYFHDPRYAPSVLQQDLIAAGFLGRKSGRGFYAYGADAAKAVPLAEPDAPAPEAVRVCGDLGSAMPLVARLEASGMRVVRENSDPRFPYGALAVGDTRIALTDGRTATVRGRDDNCPNLVLFDLALDYSRCTRLAMARGDRCSDVSWREALGMLQAAGIAVARLDDVAGLAVMRIVVMLANEASDAVMQGIATATDIDLAMQKGVNYPCGPLVWADRIGPAHVQGVLTHLAAHYGEDRYRTSPRIARVVAGGGALGLADERA